MTAGGTPTPTTGHSVDGAVTPAAGMFTAFRLSPEEVELTTLRNRVRELESRLSNSPVASLPPAELPLFIQRAEENYRLGAISSMDQEREARRTDGNVRTVMTADVPPIMSPRPPRAEQASRARSEGEPPSEPITQRLTEAEFEAA